jgi:hypothetical protein
VVQPFFSVSRSVPGDSGQLSVDGNYVITRSGVSGPPSVYDARDGEYQEPWLDATIGTPVQAVFTSAGRIVWVLDTYDGSYGMYECQVSRDYVNSFDPDAEPCSRRIDTGEPPVLGSTGP